MVYMVQTICVYTYVYTLEYHQNTDTIFRFVHCFYQLMPYQTISSFRFYSVFLFDTKSFLHEVYLKHAKHTRWLLWKQKYADTS